MSRVLILEKEEKTRQALVDRLGELVKGREVECVGASSVNEFFRQAKEQDWDVFVVDFPLNGTPNYEVLEILTRWGFRTPIIFFTGYAKDIEREIGTHHLVSAVVEKPDLEHLSFQIDLALGAAEMEKAGTPPPQDLQSGFWEL